MRAMTHCDDCKARPTRIAHCAVDAQDLEKVRTKGQVASFCRYAASDS